MQSKNKVKNEKIFINLNILNVCISSVEIDENNNINCIFEELYKWEIEKLQIRTVKFIFKGNEIKSLKYLCNCMLYCNGYILILNENELTIINCEQKKNEKINSQLVCQSFKIDGYYDRFGVFNDYVLLFNGDSFESLTSIFKFKK